MNTTDAVKALRCHLGESQQAFATRLGLSIRAIANYEKDRTPSSLALGRLIKDAHEAGREDLADVFRTAYWQDASTNFPGLTDEESAWAELLCDILRSRCTPKLKRAWGEVCKSLHQAAGTIVSEAARTQDPDLIELAASATGHLLVEWAVTSAVKFREKKGGGQ